MASGSWKKGVKSDEDKKIDKAEYERQRYQMNKKRILKQQSGIIMVLIRNVALNDYPGLKSWKGTDLEKNNEDETWELVQDNQSNHMKHFLQRSVNT